MLERERVPFSRVVPMPSLVEREPIRVIERCGRAPEPFILATIFMIQIRLKCVKLTREYGITREWCRNSLYAVDYEQQHRIHTCHTYTHADQECSSLAANEHIHYWSQIFMNQPVLFGFRATTYMYTQFGNENGWLKTTRKHNAKEVVSAENMDCVEYIVKFINYANGWTWKTGSRSKKGESNWFTSWQCTHCNMGIILLAISSCFFYCNHFPISGNWLTLK